MYGGRAMSVETQVPATQAATGKPAEASMRKRVFSGIQPTGNIHLGNYLGAIRNWVATQEEFENIFCIVDLHAITLPIDPKELHFNSSKLAALYLACGLDPKYCNFFIHYHVRQLAEASWILECFTPMGWMKKLQYFGSRPQARYRAASLRELKCNSLGSIGSVIACRSTIQKMFSNSSCVATQLRMAPR